MFNLREGAYKNMSNDKRVLTMFVILSVLAGTMGNVGADVIDRWDFNGPSGTTLNNLVNTGPGGAGFAGAGDGSITNNGSGSLVYDNNGGNQFVTAAGSVSTDTGQYELLFHLNSMTRVGTVNAGWALRDSGAAANIATILLSRNFGQDGIRMFVFDGVSTFTPFDYGTGVDTIDNVTIRTVLTLNGANPGTLDFYATDDDVDLGGGIGVEVNLGSMPTVAGRTLDAITTYKQFFDDSSENASFDYLQLSQVPEPSSLFMIGLGVAAIAFRFRRHV